MTVAVITQARMGSTRLPGKVMKRILDRTVIGWQIGRLRDMTRADVVVVATTDLPGDDLLAAHCRDELKVAVYRGSAENVLSRYYEAARMVGADCVVRVTSDCPLIDPVVCDQAVAKFIAKQGACDYLSNTQERTYPRGMDVEVFSMTALELAWRHATLAADREHVTPYLYQYGRFKTCGLLNDRDESRYRLTIDTPDDFVLVERVAETLWPINPRFQLKDIVALLEAHPEWVAINAHVEQKGLAG